ncbi:MAG: AsnC family transcriptional regulator [Nitrososphaerales archaeon]
MPDSDSLYSRVLKELFRPTWLREGGREPYVGLARRLGVDDQTIRSTIRRMQESGFLRSWTLGVNPHALQMEGESVIVSASVREASKAQIMSQVKLVEGVWCIFSFLDDPSFRLLLYHTDDADLERRIRLISSICGASEPTAVWRLNLPRCEVRPKETDWRIIRSLLEDSRKTVSEIAEETGVSTRTVARRLATMTDNSFFFLVPDVDVKKADGILYFFVLTFDDRKDKTVIDERLRNSVARIVWADTSADHYTDVAAIYQNISGGLEFSSWLKVQEGVKTVTSRVLEDITFVDDWVDHEIKRRIGG